MNAVLAPDVPVTSPLRWNQRFHQLGPRFYSRVDPQPLTDPYWVACSPGAAASLGLDASWLESDELLQALSGNRALAGTEPLASVYSGHQFGQWAGQLGDGRALLLGEVQGLEVQLKGSGLTPYSRRGDGRAVLRSSIREFLCSEAMHALGIPTTRALCVTGSDDEVWRERVETAAVVTRLAPSFVRFGHFEHFAARNQVAELRTLADYVIEHYYPECREQAEAGPKRYAHWLAAAVQSTAVMVAHWQAVGFCHGVMNTDNMSILGLTLDYGPFQFLDAYDPGHICNHSDHLGRYAFDAQPEVAHWNLFCLGQALMPLIADRDLALQALAGFEPAFAAHWQGLMRAKLGLADCAPVAEADALVQDVLALLALERVDYPLFWRRLSLGARAANWQPVVELFRERQGIDRWLQRYTALSETLSPPARALQADTMLHTNPHYVLRNYLAELAIQAAQQKDFSQVQTLLHLVTHPFEPLDGHERYADLPPAWAGQIAISCSS